MSRVVGQRASGFAAVSAGAIFFGAFLLFLVQPIVGKMILPWFGGTPAVWTTCMLFFQLLLLAGYAYAAGLSRLRETKWQAGIHLVLLMVALCLLPITPQSTWKPPDGQHPTWRILCMLSVCVGVPYFLLSATSPLIQSWFADYYPGRSPYRLYALSNIGSFAALVAYPFLVEPMWTTDQQGWFWSGCFVLFAMIGTVIAWLLYRRGTSMESNSLLAKSSSLGTSSSNAPVVSALSRNQNGVPRWRDYVAWLLLPALASGMLLAVTNYLCQDIAVVPFLWIVPLSLYLLSLVLCFDRDQWYASRWFALVAMMVILVACDIQFMTFLHPTREPGKSAGIWDYFRDNLRVIIGVYLALFFLLCVVCHGEVVRRRPDASRLTVFYLTISAGGALGGFVVAILFPAWTSSFVELKIGVLLGFIVCMRAFWVDANRHWFSKYGLPTRRLVRALSLFLVLVVASAQWISMTKGGALVQARNFYGVLTVRTWFVEDPERHGQALYHGAILHGYQYLHEKKRRTPTSYYTEKSGVGRAIVGARPKGPLHVGVVGLGVGTLAAYGQPGDRFRFYEINPLVIEIAKETFSFLRESPAQIEVVPGDARLSLERESPQAFDVIALDAFSGDSIPVHLLTREAIALYLQHLQPDGVIAVHISNRYVNLAPVIGRLAQAFELEQRLVVREEIDTVGLSSSDWMLMARSRSVLDRPTTSGFEPLPMVGPTFPIWTDQYNNLFQVLRRHGQ